MQRHYKDQQTARTDLIDCVHQRACQEELIPERYLHPDNWTKQYDMTIPSLSFGDERAHFAGDVKVYTNLVHKSKEQRGKNIYYWECSCSISTGGTGRSVAMTTVYIETLKRAHVFAAWVEAFFEGLEVTTDEPEKE
jgi:hypothetical protein